MMKTISAAALAGVLFLTPACAIAETNTSETYRQLNLFGDVFERVRSEYVEPVTDEQLIETAINGMLTALDPHSSYLNRKSFQDMQVQTRGEFGGLGIEVTMENGLIKVVSPIDDTPAFRAGLQPGDLITHLDGEAISGMSLADAVEKMRGPVGSDIKVTIRRGEGAEPFDVAITRDTIKIQSVRYRQEGDVGYIRVTTFNEQTQTGLERAVERLQKEVGDKLTGYVLDLRNNPGGLLDQAISVSDSFLDKGEIVSTRGRKPEDGQRYNAKARRPRQGQADGRADQRRLGLRVGDRRRSASGPPPRHRAGHPELRQGLRPDHHPAARPRRHAPDDGALLHAVGPLDPGARHQPGYRGPAGEGRGNRSKACAAAKPTCAERSATIR